MRKIAVAALLFSVSCGGCATGPARLPEMGTIVPEAGAESTLGRCGDLEALKEKWTEVLRMEDWRIAIGCVEIPDKEKAWALSYVEPATREITVAIDPDAPNIDETVLHEITHGLITFVRAADSELVEENAVRVLSERMLCREPKGE